MTYATFIGQLRAQVGDIKRRVHVDWTGDSIGTTVFQMPDDTYPVLDDTTTYIVKVGGTSKVENTDYTLDKTTGTLTLASDPGNGTAVSIDSIAVYLTDSDWLTIVTSSIRSLGDDYWKEFVNDSNFTTTANAMSVSLTTHEPKCIAVYEFQVRENSGINWQPVEERANWRYDRENNIIYVGNINTFPISGQALRIRGLKTYTIPSAIGETIDVQDRFLTVVEYGAIARYWRWRYKSVIELVSKMSTEASRTPLQELIMLSDRFDRMFELEKAKLKPQKPARIIPQSRPEGGRP